MGGMWIKFFIFKEIYKYGKGEEEFELRDVGLGLEVIVWS